MSLEEKINDKDAVIGIIGLGYVGLPLSVEFARAGFNVIGIDISEKKVEMLKKGKTSVTDVKEEDLLQVIQSGMLKVFSDYSPLRDADCISITVPTPLNKTKDPDITHIKYAMDKIKDYFHKDLLIVLESTTYPGTTREVIANEVERAGFTVGKDIFVAFSPERIDPGNKIYSTQNIPRVIGGITPECTKLAGLLYNIIIEKVHKVDSSEEAEMVKLLENTFRSVNIALVNEMAMMCDRMGVNIWKVIEAASTKPFGFMPFYPGPGIGGHCIPLDPVYLSWKAKSFDFYNRFINLATDINGNMPRFIVGKLQRIMNNHKKPIKDSRFLVIGIAYKSDINDIRESPSLEVFKLLEHYGAKLDYHDPYVEYFENDMGEHLSVPLQKEMLKTYDCVIILTSHAALDYELIFNNARLIFDTRNVYDKYNHDPKIVKL